MHLIHNKGKNNIPSGHHSLDSEIYFKSKPKIEIVYVHIRLLIEYAPTTKYVILFGGFSRDLT